MSRWYARSLPDHDHVCAVPDRKKKPAGRQVRAKGQDRGACAPRRSPCERRNLLKLGDLNFAETCRNLSLAQLADTTRRNLATQNLRLASNRNLLKLADLKLASNRNLLAHKNCRDSMLQENPCMCPARLGPHAAHARHVCVARQAAGRGPGVGCLVTGLPTPTLAKTC